MSRLYVYALLTALIFGSVKPEPAEKTVDDLITIIQTLQHKIETLESNEGKLQAELLETKKETGELREINCALMDMIEKMSTEQERNNNILTEEISKINIRIKDEAVSQWTNHRQIEVETLFLATLTEGSVSVQPGDPIIWDHAPINPGGHFNTILGMYEAPVHGYYQFSVTKMGNDYYGSFYLLVDEERYVCKYAYNDGSTSTSMASSATITVELTAGQIVRVENLGSTIVRGTNEAGFMYSWFTGYLLYGF